MQAVRGMVGKPRSRRRKTGAGARPTVARATRLRLSGDSVGADGRPGRSSELVLSRDQAAMQRPAGKSSAAHGKGRAAPRRTNDADRTRANILDIATQEFAEKGFTGARIDEIADRTHTSKNMIYYYFGSKENLYRKVLEKSYGEIRQIESELRLSDMPALEALRELVEFTFDYHNNHPDFVRLVMVENIALGAHIRETPTLKAMNSGAIDLCRDICKRGVKEGVIRKDVTPTSLHMTISSLCFYNVSNKHTFSAIYNVDMTSPEALRKRRAAIVDLILRYVRPD
jgi:AcrR family transcriptional regulator